MSGYSVFIPRMFSNIGENRIRRVFHEQNIGNVERVDLVSKTSSKGDTYNMAFVHFDIMYDKEPSVTFRQDVENPDTKAKLVYDEPWFWLVLPFVQKEQSPNPSPTRVNPSASDFVPPANKHIPMEYATMEEQQWANAGMVQMWVMTPQGPMIQWGYPQYMPCDIRPVITPNNTNSKTNTLKKMLKMVPRQVAYGNQYSIQRKHQRKTLNITSSASSAYPREETHAHENSAVIDSTMADMVDDKSLEEEMERQMDYRIQMEMYNKMDQQIENESKEEGEI